MLMVAQQIGRLRERLASGDDLDAVHERQMNKLVSGGSTSAAATTFTALIQRRERRDIFDS
jgi:hypothetical protein